MFLLEWSANDLLLMVVAAVAIIGTVLWLVPGAVVTHKDSYTEAEIHAYDQHIPRYFLAAALALLLGGLHIMVKNLPGFWIWLWQAGYGGHLFRDLANSHIIIVGGGTVLLTGLTWYLLPRFVNRPLYSTALASASLWFTVIGVFGFYLAWLILGLVEGAMVRQGWEYQAAKEAIGSWHTVPTRITSTIMGVGYWTYVLNVLLTAWVGRHVRVKPYGYLTKFSVVSALALFIGTVQGVLQVLPANADWIHAAGKFGQYVDPISHAHINLVTGMMVSLAAFLLYFAPRFAGRELAPDAARRRANSLFWTLVPGSLFFYLVFLLGGLSLGGYGGPMWRLLAGFMGRHLRLLLALAGSTMFAGFWLYFINLWRLLAWRSAFRQFKAATPAAFWFLSSAALVVGTLQGLLQVLPTTAYYLTNAEEVPNIHAQLNMIGGVLPALMGVVYWLLPELVGRQPEPRPVKRSLYGIGGGIFAYYVTTLVLGLVRLGLMRQGLSSVAAAEQLGWLAPWLLMISALPLVLGFFAFATAVYRATPAYRTRMAAEMGQLPGRFAGPMPARLGRIP
ncbi:MAG: cbb3-type cytochrome c oxidase subunit I, partial [Anaerolineales bacterium]|nr:cbb3-type cytochrome c oxidase subunit I [Anaerolineales bacterium]